MMHRIMLRAIGFAFVFAALPAMAQQYRTIVGVWTFPGQGCSREDGALTIGPMSLDGEDVTCRFRSVRRDANVVTWTGLCDGAEGNNQETVVATEVNNRLTIRYVRGGNVLNGLRRCR
jgi:hypothetical protein